MTERQKALLAYVQTLGPRLRKATSPNDFVNRVLSAVKEDGEFIGKVMLAGAVQVGKNVLERQVTTLATDAVGSLATMANDLIASLGKPGRRR